MRFVPTFTPYLLKRTEAHLQVLEVKDRTYEELSEDARKVYDLLHLYDLFADGRAKAAFYITAAITDAVAGSRVYVYEKLFGAEATTALKKIAKDMEAMLDAEGNKKVPFDFIEILQSHILVKDDTYHLKTLLEMPSIMHIKNYPTEHLARFTLPGLFCKYYALP